MIPLFVNHEYGATALNEIKTRANGDGVVAIAGAAREFKIIDGVVSLVIKPTVEPEVIIEASGDEIV